MLLLIPVPVVLAGLGCGASLREADEKGYSVTARQNYERGVEKLEDDDWLEATKYFTFVKARFPFSKYAVLAELRLADTAFASGSHLEAIDAYRQFYRAHPTHTHVLDGYTAFRTCEAQHKLVPSSWFIFPPDYEMDLSPAYDLLRELDSFIQQYPASRFRKRAVDLRTKCAHLLAAHEWYVANFYWARNQPMGTVLRLRALLTKYPGVGYDEDALWLLGKAYVKAGRLEDARTTWQSLITKHPKHKRALEVEKELATLGAESHGR
ncbi:MAG: outer membrane protein assembly factor BamD [Pseudomonadota bacterium]